MNIQQAKDYFKIGVIDCCYIVAPDNIHDGYTLELNGKTGGILVTSTREVRVFKTLDSAVKVAKVIGFKKLEVQL